MSDLRRTGGGLLTRATECVVCGKSRKGDAHPDDWQPIIGGFPIGAFACSEKCMQLAKQRYRENNRMDMPCKAEKQASDKEDITELPTQPPAAPVTESSLAEQQSEPSHTEDVQHSVEDERNEKLAEPEVEPEPSQEHEQTEAEPVVQAVVAEAAEPSEAYEEHHGEPE